MRGVGFIVAVTVVAEVGDFQRFDNPRQLMPYLGLTPSEHSSGASVRRGGITKAGSGLARRALIEGAWSYPMQARVSPKLLARLDALPKSARDIAWKGQLRMCQRYRHLVAAGKAKVVVITMKYNLLFRWFVSFGIDDPVWVPTVFTKNRDRLLTTEMSRRFFQMTTSRSTARW
jgi:hypothetical protein